MEYIVAPDARWPDRLRDLCLRCRSGVSGEPVANAGHREGTSAPGLAPVSPRAAAWVALRDALMRFLRAQSRRYRGVSVEDLEDLGSEKALELLTRAESGEWNLEGRSGAEVGGYLSTVARNALIDLVKRRARIVGPVDSGSETASREPEFGASAAKEWADDSATAHEYVECLRGCVATLQPRARRIWFFRAFYDMSSRRIAQHPAVQLKPPHVDVIIQRTRTVIRDCMHAKGFDPSDMPPGSFVALWEALESLETGEMPAVAARAGMQA